MLEVLTQTMIILLFPPLMFGIINKTKAFWSGCKGPPFLQVYFDIKKNLLKDFVFSTSTTWIFKAAPIVALVAILLAGFNIPTTSVTSVIAFSGNLFIFVYLFGLARFFMTMAALDTGSSFAGMGAAREVTFACFSELSLIFILLIYAKLGNTLQLDQMFLPRNVPFFDKSNASLILVIFSLFIVLLVENGRIPFDDQSTHLELTMIHEVIILDYSGPLLGLITYGASIRLYVLGAIVVRTLFSFSSVNIVFSSAAFLVAMALLAVVIGTLESMMARLKLLRIPNLIITSCVLAVFGLLFVMN